MTCETFEVRSAGRLLEAASHSQTRGYCGGRNRRRQEDWNECRVAVWYHSRRERAGPSPSPPGRTAAGRIDPGSRDDRCTPITVRTPGITLASGLLAVARSTGRAARSAVTGPGATIGNEANRRLTLPSAARIGEPGSRSRSLARPSGGGVVEVAPARPRCRKNLHNGPAAHAASALNARKPLIAFFS